MNTTENEPGLISFTTSFFWNSAPTDVIQMLQDLDGVAGMALSVDDIHSCLKILMKDLSNVIKNIQV